MKTKVFYGGFEVRPTDKNTIMAGKKGGFVYCFSAAEDIRSALDKMEESFAEDEYLILFCEFVRVYEQIDWDDPEEQVRHDALATEVMETNENRYGIFYTYETE